MLPKGYYHIFLKHVFFPLWYGVFKDNKCLNFLGTAISNFYKLFFFFPAGADA